MSYENAPATKMLATHCAACARPLVDATSVEIGLGPDCRRKHGVNDGKLAGTPEANRIVYQIALQASRGEMPDPSAVNALRDLGFIKLADRIVKRTCKISLEIAGDRYVVKTPYSEELVNAWRSIPGRVWDRERKANTVPVASKSALWKMLRRAYPGALASGPKGVFQIC